MIVAKELTIEQRHNVPTEYRHLPFCELSQFIMTKLEETKYPTVKELSEWFEEHAQYYGDKNILFGYG